ncbi:DNA-binding transcriptional LysR family regulator [Paraburkholderia caledonica]|uniref:DNA-binding transcriptional LysR family regulator n=1 Tax=Paraburkholderia caledonica TaxID=134536 RepID=A0ABU1KYT8_9BURK|nr:DNA-binding transcriptional LysR family regulator [Paraburkholderia caledonica]
MQNLIAKDEGLTGRLRFGVGELSALTWLPRFVAALQKQHPKLLLEPTVDVGANLSDKVDAGELDFAVVAGNSARGSVLSQSVGKATFAWMAAEQLVGRERRLTPALIAAHPLVVLPAASGVTRILDEWLLEQGINHPRKLTCNNWSAIAGMLREGVGIGFLPVDWATNRLRQELVQLESEPALAPLHYAFQWRRGDVRGLIPAMLTLVRQYVDFR